MLILVCYFLLLVFLKIHTKEAGKDLVLFTTLIFSLFIVCLTEILSLFKSLNVLIISICWSNITTILFCFLFIKRKQVIQLFVDKKKRILKYHQSLPIYEKLLLYFVFAALLLLLFQGIVYPPNNWDSMTYHMSRIMFWLGNESVSNFPTFILRQLYQPPFAEYCILNLNVLNGNDYFSNNVQWVFLVLTIISVTSILDYFKFPSFFKLVAAFLLVTIPSVELQASTTKNDIVCGFFVITMIYYCLKCRDKTTLLNFILLGFSVGLGLLTKGTAYLFFAPIIVAFIISIILKSLKSRNFLSIFYGLIIIFIVILINIGHFYRNYTINHNILNIDPVEEKAYSNEEMDIKLLLSNLLKNSGLHLGYPISRQADIIIRKIHTDLNINIDNPATNYYGMPYQTVNEINTHEDTVPNTIHFFLIVISFLGLGILLFRNHRKYLKHGLLGLVIIAQLLLFAGFLKWQPWHTRLHIPIFLLSVILIISCAKEMKWFKYILLFTLPFLCYSFYFYCFFNNIRPLSQKVGYTRNIKITDTRFKKYFVNQPHLLKEYSEIENQLYSNDYRKIGLIIDDWEYPLFHSYYSERLHLVDINVQNITNTVVQDTKNIECIISNVVNEDFIEYDGRKYKNISPKHSYIWFYK